MIRNTIRKLPEPNPLANCFHCPQPSVAIVTDRVTGDEFRVCQFHTPKAGNCRRNQLHNDFKRNTQKNPIELHTNLSQNQSYEEDGVAK